MTKIKPSVEIKPTSFSEVVNSEQWGSALRRAAAAGSVAIIEASEHPAPNETDVLRPKRPNHR